MNPTTESATHRTLKRLLVNGLLTGLPKRAADQDVIVELAALRFDTVRVYREAQVNEILKEWLATFCAPYGIDHVTLRRQLVDARLLSREKSGASYRVDAVKVALLAPDAGVEPAAVLAELQAERAERKRHHPG